ncbi:MAG: phosphoadenylyl-sulfate reductase [Planctomycetota bacterium]
MTLAAQELDVKGLVEELTFKQKVDRALDLIREAHQQYGDRLVIAHSLGKDSCVVWDLAKRVSPDIKGFIITTRFQPKETKRFMDETVEKYPELKVYESDVAIPDKLYKTDPDRCCELLKVVPTREAIEDLNVACWVTGLRCTEGRTRTDFQEAEERDEGLIKLNPILTFYEREVWQYLALYQVETNPLYKQGYRSLGCATCTNVSTGEDERAGRWIGTSKCGGECGIHTRPLKVDYQI